MSPTSSSASSAFDGYGYPQPPPQQKVRPGKKKTADSWDYPGFAAFAASHRDPQRIFPSPLVSAFVKPGASTPKGANPGEYWLHECLQVVAPAIHEFPAVTDRIDFGELLEHWEPVPHAGMMDDSLQNIGIFIPRQPHFVRKCTEASFDTLQPHEELHQYENLGKFIRKLQPFMGNDEIATTLKITESIGNTSEIGFKVAAQSREGRVDISGATAFIVKHVLASFQKQLHRLVTRSSDGSHRLLEQSLADIAAIVNALNGWHWGGPNSASSGVRLGEQGDASKDRAISGPLAQSTHGRSQHRVALLLCAANIAYYALQPDAQVTLQIHAIPIPDARSAQLNLQTWLIFAMERLNYLPLHSPSVFLKPVQTQDELEDAMRIWQNEHRLHLTKGWPEPTLHWSVRFALANLRAWHPIRPHIPLRYGNRRCLDLGAPIGLTRPKILQGAMIAPHSGIRFAVDGSGNVLDGHHKGAGDLAIAQTRKFPAPQQADKYRVGIPPNPFQKPHMILTPKPAIRLP